MIRVRGAHWRHASGTQIPLATRQWHRAAYGWSPEMSDDELLAALLKLNLERAGA